MIGHRSSVKKKKKGGALALQEARMEKKRGGEGRTLTASAIGRRIKDQGTD